MRNEYLVAHQQVQPFRQFGQDKFDWAELGRRNIDIPDKILGFAGARLVRKRDDDRYLPEELLPQGMPESQYNHFFKPRQVDMIETETLVLERPRHDILSHGPHEKMKVTFSSCVDRNWWGFAKYAEAGWPLDVDAVCAAMDFKQTVTDVIAIRLVPTNRSEFRADARSSCQQTRGTLRSCAKTSQETS